MKAHVKINFKNRLWAACLLAFYPRGDDDYVIDEALAEQEALKADLDKFEQKIGGKIERQN